MKALEAALDAAFPELFADTALPKSPFDDASHAPLTPLDESDAATLSSARLALACNQRRLNDDVSQEKAA
ncbi:hypothetical protein ACHZ97_04135 [Lysobacter soli]|uniref:hypothetical protein n=1 Tax=Lysobacter soli TaxID=453783 RepID=UPI0037CB392D